ncbi:MAG: hypothetical protein C4297_10485 [Gemmataceae bacterium]
MTRHTLTEPWSWRPGWLPRRRARFPYARAEYEEVPCALCGASDAEAIAQRDRNGLPVQTVICRICGLLYICPRMSALWYARYYAEEYRRQMAAYHGTDLVADPEQLYRGQYRRSSWLAAYLQRHGVRPRRILEIGSSAGGLLAGLRDALGADVLGIEPGPEEAGYANEHGVPTVCGLFEQLAEEAIGHFDLVVCSQSFNHLLHPRRVAQKVRAALSSQGYFFLECQDFFQVLRYKGALCHAIQIDHPYMFVPATLRGMMEVSGLEIVEKTWECDAQLSDRERQTRARLGVPTLHVRFLARIGPVVEAPSCTYADVVGRLRALPDRPWRATLHTHWHRWRHRLRPYYHALKKRWAG